MSLAENRTGPQALKDPELQREFHRLETDEERQDFLDAPEKPPRFSQIERPFPERRT
jgi:hypothetical protein